MYRKVIKSRVLFRLLVFLLLSLAIKQADAQYYSTGQEAASIRWKMIKSEHVKLVFPDYYEDRARKLASYLDTTWYYASRTLDHQPKKISLVLHTQSATANAVVVWAPKRMEFYTTPPQDMYAQPWLEQLSLHEYRHVVQIDKLNQGPTKVISWIFGQQGTGAILGLYVPPWFLEGDATATETGLSKSGRGRLPVFEMKLRAQLLEKGIYSYDKAVLGSYRDFTPNAYELGYHLVTEGRRQYGPELWSHTLDMVAKRPYMVTPFQKGIRDISGKRKSPFYHDCLLGLKKQWEVQDRLTESMLMIQRSPDTRLYTSYRHPAVLDDGRLIALKTSIDDISRIVAIDTNNMEEVLYTPGFIKTETLSYASGKICWAETRPDLRWSNRSFTVIKVYDIIEGGISTFKYRMRLFAPRLSDDASKIVAVHNDSLDQYAMVIIDVESKNLVKHIAGPQNAYPLTPAWAGQDHVLTVLVSDAGKALAKINVETGDYSLLTDWSYDDIAQAVYQKPYIYFTASWSGISNIYRLDEDKGSIEKISFSRFGAVDPVMSADGGTLMFADYTSDGYRIVEHELEYYEKVPLNFVLDRSIGLYRTLEEQEEPVEASLADIPESEAASKKYSKIANLFNFHSWAPLDINASTYSINPGVSIMSQNLLSSSFLSLGYQYNVNEQAGKVYGSYSYQGWYPIIDIYADYGLRRQTISHPISTELTWNETNIKAGLRLPLNLTSGKYYAGITPTAYLRQILRKMRPGNLLEFTQPNITATEYGLQMYRQIKRSERDIFPKWGQSLNLYYYDTPFESPGYSSIAAGIATFYIPGILRHHGINLYGGYQYRVIGYYKFSDIVSYPRGITDQQDEQLYSFRGTYAFPIAYPDWSIGPVVYMKRIRASLFYDYAVGFNPHSDNYYNSMGVDLITEVHLLRFLAPFELGVRSIYLPDENAIEWNFLFGVGF